MNLYQILLFNIDAAKVQRALNGTILQWNKTAQELFGFTKQEILGQSDSLYIPSDILKKERAAVEGGEYYNEHSQRQTKLGQLVDVVVSIKPIRDEKGKIFSLEETSMDIDSLVRIYSLYVLVVEHSPIGKILVTAEGVILMSNQQMERIFGYSKEELLGQPVEMLLPSQLRSIHLQHRAGFNKDPSIRRMGIGRELFGRRKDGSEVPVEIGLTSMRSGERLYVMAGIVDITGLITDRTQAASLQRSNQDLEQFAYVASHDLQAPLRHIDSFVQLLAEKYAAIQDEETAKWIKYIVDGTTQMRELINALLSFSHVTKAHSSLELVDLNEIFDGIKDQLADKIEQYQGSVESEPLPTLLVHRVLIRQLLSNLIENSLKFHKPGEPPLIQISAVKNNETWEIMVTDNGIGIDPKYYNKLFTIFQRLQPQVSVAGTGIGLAICKRIVELHEGHIWVESQKGEGATFHFTIKDTTQGEKNDTTPSCPRHG